MGPGKWGMTGDTGVGRYETCEGDFNVVSSPMRLMGMHFRPRRAHLDSIASSNRLRREGALVRCSPILQHSVRVTIVAMMP
jgi:hypothetical protein